MKDILNAMNAGLRGRRERMDESTSLPITCWACQKKMEKDYVGQGWNEVWYVLNRVVWNGYGFKEGRIGWACSKPCLEEYVAHTN